ncbi:MAG: type I methionyl aminopeptidase [Chloroflexota bacterium]
MVAKNKRDLEGLRRANVATARLLGALVAAASPGVTTRSLDEFAARYIRRIGGEPVFHTQNGFPACINTSVNDEAVHGVPGGRVLAEGDLLKIDCGIRLNGYCGDSTVTVGVGAPDRLSAPRRAVMEAAREALARGIDAVRVGGHVGDIGYAMDSYVRTTGFQLLRHFTGHGLGTRLWEAPAIPAVGLPGTGDRIVDRLVFTIEPIVVGGGPKTYVASDGWTVCTVDRAPAAQFEHTIIATKHGPVVLSRIS